MKRSTCVLACFLCSMIAPFLAAQAPVKPGSAESAPARPETITRHLRIEVLMDNGGVVSGVARDGLLVERRVKQDFEALGDEQRNRFDAGVRIWFYDDLPGFLFIRYRHIDTVRLVGPVTASEMKRLDAKHNSWENGEGVLRPIERAADPEPDVFEPPTFANKPQPGADDLTDEQKRLLDRFPPPAGWSPKRYENLQRDLVLAGRDLTASEDQWSRVYPEWLEAYRVFTGVAAPEKPAPASKAASSGFSSVAPPRIPARATAPRPSAPAEKSGKGKGAGVKTIDVKSLRDLGGLLEKSAPSSSGGSPGGGGIERGGRR